MSVSSQRLFIMLLGFHIFIGFAIAIVNDPFTFDWNSLNTMQEFVEDQEREVITDEGIWGTIKSTASQFTETSPGNAIKMAWFPFKVFLSGVNVLNIHPFQFNNLIVQIMAMGVIIFRMFLLGLTVFEGYLVYKNRKSN